MQKAWLIAFLVLSVVAAGSAPANPEPDAGKAVANEYQSFYFKFHYSFPKGWLAVSDSARMAQNRKRHEDFVERDRQLAPHDPNHRIFWIYDLLIATPASLPAGEHAAPPRVSVWAKERHDTLNDGRDDIRIWSSIPGIRLLHKTEEVTFSRHKFVRADFFLGHGTYEEQFVTVMGNYLVGFEFRGGSVKEINELAASMKDLQFK